jgi:hypothetical protein
MRLPRLRFTVRWLMLVVAIAAISVWGLSRDYAVKGQQHRSSEAKRLR